MTAKYGTPYFSNYINSDMKPSDIRSMCPLHGSEYVLAYLPDTKEWVCQPIQNLWRYTRNTTQKIQILLNGKLHDAKINEFEHLNFKQVTCSNGHKVIVSDNHLNLVLRNGQLIDVPASELQLTDMLPFNQEKFTKNRLDDIDGAIVGLFYKYGSDIINNTVTYNILKCDDEHDDILKYLPDITKRRYGADSFITDHSDYTEIEMSSAMLKGLICDHIDIQTHEDHDTLCMSIYVINKSKEFKDALISTLVEDKHITCKTEKECRIMNAIIMSMGCATRIENKNNEYYIYGIESKDARKKYDCILHEEYLWSRITDIQPVYQNETGYCFEITDPDGEPYFTLPSGLITHNCRLRLNLRELRNKNGGFFGSGESTGSIGVVTINMPRLAYLSKTEKEFYERLDKIMDISARSLHIKRETINNLFNNGLYPYTKRYLDNFENHFSTIGLVGMNEAGLNACWLNADMSDPRVQKFTKEVLTHMRDRLSDYQEQYPGELYNLEATPAESTSYRLAKHDRERYPDIKSAGSPDETPYYTNSSHLPVNYTTDIFDALDIQDELQTLYTSGTVFHGFLGEKLPSWKSARSLVKKIAENYRLPYYTLSPTYSVCKEHGYLSGEQFTCPTCGQPTEVYSRITGYYRPVQNWNDGKTQEYKHRTEYDLGYDLREKGAPPSNLMGKPSDHSHECKNTCKHCTCETKANTQEPNSTNNTKPMLFTTSTCPNCKAVKKMLESKGVYNNVAVINAEEQPELAKKYNIQSVPVLVINDNKYTGIGEIKQLIDSII